MHRIFQINKRNYMPPLSFQSLLTLDNYSDSQKVEKKLNVR